MDADTNTEESMFWIDVVEQVVVIVVLCEMRILALEVEEEAFEVGIAVRHQLDGFFFGFHVGALLDDHT